jgi:hypothetical protein
MRISLRPSPFRYWWLFNPLARALRRGLWLAVALAAIGGLTMFIAKAWSLAS